MLNPARTLVLTAALAGAALPAAAQQNAWRDTLTARIEQAFPHSDVAGDFMRVTRPGAVLVLRKDGVATKPGMDGLMLTTHYKDGSVVQPHGFWATVSGTETMRSLKSGDRVYVLGTHVRDGEVMMSVLTTETQPVTINGNTRQTRYSGSLTFDFPRGYLATASPDSVLKTMTGLLQTEAAASAPASISLGQTQQQVEAALGKPDTVINLGAKVIWVYRSMRVIFQDGKVADVQ